MIEITDVAAKKIQSLMAKQGIEEGGLRVGVKGGGCSGLSYTFAWEKQARLGDEAADELRAVGADVVLGQRDRLDGHLALELVHVPAAGAHRRAHAERRVLHNLARELAGDFEMMAFRCDPVDHAGRKRLLGGKEATR